MCEGSINWIGDNYCDDRNNNAACNFDGGDCCDNSTPGWDSYCSVSLQHIYNIIYHNQITWNVILIFCKKCISNRNCFCSVCKFFFFFY